jgi:hypothetical protein
MNIKLSAFPKELELYEKSGILLPVARIIQPDEYIIKRRQYDQQSNTYGKGIPGWEELERMLYAQRPTDYKDDSDLWHYFDREFSSINRYLHRPSFDQFKPWKSYRAEVEDASGEKIKVKTAKHYYHRWQIHQIYAIRKKYPVFARHSWLLQNLKDDVKDKAAIYIPSHEDAITTLSGMANYLDALSFYIELHKNERRRTFAPIPENYGVKHLNDQQFEQYQKNLIRHAQFTLNRYSISIDELIQFLVDFLELHNEYQSKEKIKLANDIEDDLLFLVKFITGVTGYSVRNIEDEISKRTTFWVKKKFRHIDKALEVFDYSQETFERLMADYNKIVPGSNVSSQDINELLDFLEMKGLFIIPYAIYDIDETINSNRGFRTTLLYNGLSSLTTGLECFIREIANTANKNSGTSIGTKTFYPIINTMFSWGSVFNQEHGRIKNNSQNDALSYITDVHTDPNLDDVVKMFLIAYRARNLVAHNYILEQDLYHGLYSIIYTAIIHALFYSWIYAKQEGWV